MPLIALTKDQPVHEQSFFHLASYQAWLKESLPHVPSEWLALAEAIFHEEVFLQDRLRRVKDLEKKVKRHRDEINRKEKLISDLDHALPTLAGYFSQMVHLADVMERVLQRKTVASFEGEVSVVHAPPELIEQFERLKSEVNEVLAKHPLPPITEIE